MKLELWTLPEQFKLFKIYIQSLKYNEKPDYKYIRGLFNNKLKIKTEDFLDNVETNFSCK